MANRFLGTAAFTAIAALCWTASPAHAKDEAVEIAKCAAPIGSIAIVDGDTQGWAKYGLGSPRELIAAMAAESGCFTMANGRADFLLTAIAGDKEEVNQGIDAAKSAVMQGALRTGALGAVARVPFAGQMMGMFGGMGGKKKIVAAGLKVVSPSTGQTLVAGSGEASKSTITFGGAGGGMFGAATGAVAGSGYGTSKDGQLLTTAFIKAFNSVVGQAATLTAVGSAGASATVASAAPSGYSTAVDTMMYAKPAKGATLRSVRANSTLTPTGKREGLFVEVKDNFGTQGWVSVEDLK